MSSYMMLNNEGLCKDDRNNDMRYEFDDEVRNS